MTAVQTFGFNPRQWRWPKGAPGGRGGQFMDMPWFLTAEFLKKMDRMSAPGGRRGKGKGRGEAGPSQAARDREASSPNAPLDSIDAVQAAINKPGGIRELSADLNDKGIDASAVDVLDNTNKVRDQIASIRSRMDDAPDFPGKSKMARDMDRTDGELAKVSAVPESDLEGLLDEIRLSETDPGAAGIGSWDEPGAPKAPEAPKTPEAPAAKPRVGDDETSGGGDTSGSRGGTDEDLAAAGDNVGGYLDNNELPETTPEGVHSSLNKAAESADRMKERDTSTDEGKAAWREDALDAQAGLDDALRQLEDSDDPAMSDVKDSVAALHKDLTDGLGNGDTERDWTQPGQDAGAAGPGPDAAAAPGERARPPRPSVAERTAEPAAKPRRKPAVVRRKSDQPAAQKKWEEDAAIAKDSDLATAGSDVGDWLDGQEARGGIPDEARIGFDVARKAVDSMSQRDGSTPEGRAARREDALDAQAGLDDALEAMKDSGTPGTTGLVNGAGNLSDEISRVLSDTGEAQRPRGGRMIRQGGGRGPTPPKKPGAIASKSDEDEVLDFLRKTLGDDSIGRGRGPDRPGKGGTGIPAFDPNAGGDAGGKGAGGKGTSGKGAGAKGAEKPAWRRPRRDTVLELDPNSADETNKRIDEWHKINRTPLTIGLSDTDKDRLGKLDEKSKDMQAKDLGTKNGREEWKKDALAAEAENTALLDSIGRDEKNDGKDALRKELLENEKAFDVALGRKGKSEEEKQEEEQQDKELEDADRRRDANEKEAKSKKHRWRPPWWANEMGGGFPDGLGGGFPGLDLPHFKKKRKKAGAKKKKGRKKAKKKPTGDERLIPTEKRPTQPNAPRHEPEIVRPEFLDAIKSVQAKGGHLGDLAAGTDPLEIPGLGDALSGLSQATKSMALHDSDDPEDMRGWHQDALAADFYANDAAGLVGMMPTDDGFNPLRAALADYHGSVSGLEEWAPEDLANTLAGLPLRPLDADDPALDDMLDALSVDQGLNPADIARAQQLLGTDTGPTGLAEGAALLRGMSTDAENPSIGRNLADMADTIGGRSSTTEIGGTRVGAREDSSNMRWTLPGTEGGGAAGEQEPAGGGAAALPQGVHSTGSDGSVPLGSWMADNGGELGGLLKGLGITGGVPQSYPEAADALGDARAALLNGEGDADDLPATLGRLDALGDSLAEASWPRMPQGVHESAMMTDPILGQLGAAARDQLNVAMEPNTRLVGGPDPNTWLALGEELDQIVPKMRELGLLDTSMDFEQGERSLWDTNVQYPDSSFPNHGTAAAMADMAGLGDRPSALKAMPNAQVEGYDAMGATAPASSLKDAPAILLGMGAVTTEMLDRGLYSPAQAAARIDRYESITREIGSDAFDDVTSRLTAVAEGKPDPVSNAVVAKEWEDLDDMTKKRKKDEPSLVAAGFPVQPPSAWFADPKLPGPTPLTIEPDGRIYGHLAPWGVCHMGKAGCVTAPQSNSNYAYFRTGVVQCNDGSMVSVGRITMDTGHAEDSYGVTAAVRHYDHTGMAVADVAAGDDQWGIWVAGAMRPQVTDKQLRTLRASPPSGDWRLVGHNLELVAALCVNTPGFPVIRAQGFVASGEVQTLIASGFMFDEPEPKSLLDARVEARRLRLAKLEMITSMGQKRELEHAAVALSARVHKV